ncbi:MAG: hypothetical protein RMJ53_04755 [Chitinophagales bacterium]|nr:hypothetical protein [Chitinophagales bacterium]
MILIIIFSCLVIGIWMGYFVRHGSASTGFFKINSKTLFKLWLGLLVTGVVVTSLITFRVNYLIETSSSSNETVLRFRDWFNLSQFSVGFFFLPFLFISNLYSITVRQIEYVMYLLTFCFGALFSYRNSKLAQRMAEHVHSSLGDSSFNISFIADSPIWYISILGFLVLFNALAVAWGLKKW